MRKPVSAEEWLRSNGKKPDHGYSSGAVCNAYREGIKEAESRHLPQQKLNAGVIWEQAVKDGVLDELNKYSSVMEGTAKRAFILGVLEGIHASERNRGY